MLNEIALNEADAVTRDERPGLLYSGDDIGVNHKIRMVGSPRWPDESPRKRDRIDCSLTVWDRDFIKVLFPILADECTKLKDTRIGGGAYNHKIFFRIQRKDAAYVYKAIKDSLQIALRRYGREVKWRD